MTVGARILGYKKANAATRAGTVRGVLRRHYGRQVGYGPSALTHPTLHRRTPGVVFLAVQHPAADGVKDWKPFGRESTFEDPATRWPDFNPAMPPRPSVVAIRRKGGGKIAT
ncbi:MAG TPA: hypothetical protein VN524_09290 [Hyphomicrobiaceae bacterium]|jgi:hypothetical protein|nr:hypothetical protein [Hyphomicrobiaceae bacterium]